jgi:ribosomal protein S18 acetylase RimI-like enzyme
MFTIRPFDEADWLEVWPILRDTVATGDTYTFPPNSSESDLHNAWVEVPAATYVACDEHGAVAGTYFIKANQPGLGSHVCNCGYVVAKDFQGKGIAAQMCEHSQRVAIQMGFRAMQFNFVVATNERAIHIWTKLGFSIVGRLPGAFKHHALGYVDVFIMFKQLVND